MIPTLPLRLFLAAEFGLIHVAPYACPVPLCTPVIPAQEKGAGASSTPTPLGGSLLQGCYLRVRTGYRPRAL